MKKLAAIGLAFIMTAGLCIGCGSKEAPQTSDPAPEAAAAGNTAKPAGDDADSKADAADASGQGTKITLLNTKSELQTQFEEMAKKYQEQTGVTVEVNFTSDVVGTHLAGKYAAGDPYTIMLVDHPDVYDFQEYLADLSGEDWIKDGGDTYGITIDGKVYSFPFTVEAVGLIYNADAIEKITGETFKPADYAALDKFEGLLKKLADGGMAAPVAVNKDDWSLANHFFGQLYDQQGNSADGSIAFVDSLKSGETKLSENARFQSLMDSFDLLKKYNINGSDPLSADYDLNNSYLAEGQVAFWFNGSWATEIYEHTENIGIMPLPQKDTTDDANTKLVSGASKEFVIDAKYATPEQQQAAKDFLNWLVYEEAGQTFMVDECSIIPAFSNIRKKVSAPLSASAQEYINAGQSMYWYQEIPGDHGTEAGASLQKYLGGNSKRDELASEIETYWQAQK